MVQIREELDLVLLNLPVQFERYGKHLSLIKAQGTLIYSTEHTDQLS